MTTVHEPESDPFISSNQVTLEIIERIRDGEAGAWEALHKRYRETLTRLARGRLNGDIRRRLDTEDLVQSAFIAAHKGLNRFEHRGPGSFHAWLRQILTNGIRQRQREHLCDQRDARRHADEDTLVEQSDLSTLTPSEAVLAGEEQVLYAEAVSELAEMDREILVATHINGESVVSVSARLGLSEASVRRHRVQAIETLTRKLK